MRHKNSHKPSHNHHQYLQPTITMRIQLTLCVMLICALSTHAQTTQQPTKKAGDFIESFSNNAPSDRAPRTMQYTPEDGGFVCVNGTNRFTRALYGTHTDYRLETSDRPVFALYKNKLYRNLRFLINGLPLDSTDYCKATYKDGRRTYILRDKRWGTKATLTIDCVMMHDSEGSYFRFTTQEFKHKAIITAKICDIANPRLRRNGDIGADKAGSFEHAPSENNLMERNFSIAKNGSTLIAIHHETGQSQPYTFIDAPQTKHYLTSVEHYENIAHRIVFNTPAPWLNAIAPALTLAADGVWDGDTWLHGAIGWRMPLAGWRAGYLGDVLGWPDRAISHFNAYAESQVTDVPPTIAAPSQDEELHMARARKEWGTQMYSNGYICRNPHRNNQMHHYDMNLNYIDELLWHFQYDADTTYMRRMWPVVKRHLEWEKRNFDPDGNHLYDAYCCIWASDALYYNGGEVTHSSAYNYRGNRLAARMAELLGEDATPYSREADAIRNAMNQALWVNPTDNKRYSATQDNAYIGHWAEYRDVMGLQRQHSDAALWSIYTPIDCGVGTDGQNYSLTKYVDTYIPHIPLAVENDSNNIAHGLSLVSTSDWMPYSWSINNVASAEMMHTALAMFQAGRADSGYSLLKANIMDQMYLGSSPANFGQISYYDAARGESYRDFGDNVGISSRAIIQGLFGIVPQALYGQCIIRPGFPLDWDSCSVSTPYISYTYKRMDGNNASIHIKQHMAQPLQMTVRINGNNGATTDYPGTTATEQTIVFQLPQNHCDSKPMTQPQPYIDPMVRTSVQQHKPLVNSHMQPLDMDSVLNANVTDIFRNEYRTPRPQSTSLELPTQGVGEWCHPLLTYDIDDTGYRAAITNDTYTIDGITFRSPKQGHNIAFVSQWDNYPETISLNATDNHGNAPHASRAHLMLCGSTNHMQAYTDNAIITAVYTDGTADTLSLYPPYNYCPIEQDYYVDGMAFKAPIERPLRIALATNTVSRELGKALGIAQTEVYGRTIRGGAAQLLTMPLNPDKSISHFTLRALANDVVVGVMAITLESEQ